MKADIHGATFIDTGMDAVLDTANLLNFFQDDLMVQNDASSGAIALLNIYNYVLDSNAIKQNFNNLQGQIFSTRNIMKENNFRVYPNPANDKVVIDLKPLNASGIVGVSILDLTGTVVYTNRFNAGSIITLDVNALQVSSGMYFVMAESASGVSMKKIVIRK